MDAQQKVSRKSIVGLLEEILALGYQDKDRQPRRRRLLHGKPPSSWIRQVGEMVLAWQGRQFV